MLGTYQMRLAAPIRLRLSYVSVIRALKTGDVGVKVARYQAFIHVLIGRNDGGHWAFVSVEIYLLWVPIVPILDQNRESLKLLIGIDVIIV
jgi:hypothetical protein